MSTIYEVYQWFPCIGRYGEHVKIAQYRSEEDAKARVSRIHELGITASYREKVVSC